MRRASASGARDGMNLDDLAIALFLYVLPALTVSAGLVTRRVRGGRPNARRLGTYGFVVQLVGAVIAAAIFSLMFVTRGSVWSEDFARIVVGAAVTWGGAHLVALVLHAAAWRVGGASSEVEGPRA